ncbi:hypothetical protein RQCS_27640 [Rhodococcus qingshengii]|nr:hypothetical protein RQCS_27640 [Rhodococcus qingshengii]
MQERRNRRFHKCGYCQRAVPVCGESDLPNVHTLTFTEVSEMGQNESRFALDYRGNLCAQGFSSLRQPVWRLWLQERASPAPRLHLHRWHWAGAQESCCRTWITPILTELQHAR